MEASEYLFHGAKYPQALYYLFQSIEKVLKATQIELVDTDPKKIHRLETLAIESGIEPNQARLDQLTELSKHYGRIRYTDYAQSKYNTLEKVNPIFSLGKEIYQWIIQTLNNH